MQITYIHSDLIYLITKVLSWDFHIDHMEVSQHLAFIFKLQNSWKPVLNIALKNIFPVFQSLSQLGEGTRESGCAFWIKITLKILLVLSDKIDMLINSISREASSANTRQLLFKRLGNLSSRGSRILIAAVKQRIDNSKKSLLR